MRVAVLCHGTVLQPALAALYSQNLLVGLGVPDRLPEINLPLEQAAQQAGIPFVRVQATALEEQLNRWLEDTNPDVICTMGFPHKIPGSLLEKPRLGFFNFHGGALPQYRGPDPVFWQIRNQEPHGAIAIHRIAPELDTGGIAHTEAVPIGPEETYGLHLQRLGAVLPRLLIELVQQLEIHGNALPLTEQPAAAAHYWQRPGDADLTVDWTAAAVAIKALVRACNPVYAGALTLIKGIPVRLLQVTGGIPYNTKEITPGTMVEASTEQGILVACGQGQTLSLDIVYAQDGFFTGQQLVRVFGLGVGDRMGS
jgi:methionyl-tRNA formyltransferase